MAKKGKKQGMSREQAQQLYDSLKKSMEQKYGKRGLESLIKEGKKGGGNAQNALAELAGGSETAMRKMPPATAGSGNRLAIGLIVLFASAKIVLSVLETSGIATVEKADASIGNLPAQTSSFSQFSPEEVGILKNLDGRRAKLEERSKRIDSREDDMNRRERELAARLTELRDISNRLRLDRAKNTQKRSAQLEQLANVYGSMNPKESAELIEQLDITIALQLIERMPDKRIGQILSLMRSEKALVLTRMLSNSK